MLLRKKFFFTEDTIFLYDDKHLYTNIRAVRIAFRGRKNKHFFLVK